MFGVVLRARLQGLDCARDGSDGRLQFVRRVCDELALGVLQAFALADILDHGDSGDDDAALVENRRC